MYQNKKILYLSPHTDDVELGCGASLVKFIENNNDIYIICFSAARKSIPSGFSEDTTEKEFYKSCDVLNIKKDNVVLYNFETRSFPNFRQEILEELVSLNNSIDPDIIFCPSLNDMHQDHYVIASECFRAFKKKTIFGYEVLWNNLHFNYSGFITFEEKHLQIKLNAISQYVSQKIRMGGGIEFVRDLANVRGTQCGAKFAEAFEVIRLNMK